MVIFKSNVSPPNPLPNVNRLSKIYQPTNQPQPVVSGFNVADGTPICSTAFQKKVQVPTGGCAVGSAIYNINPDTGVVTCGNNGLLTETTASTSYHPKLATKTCTSGQGELMGSGRQDFGGGGTCN